MNKKKINSWRIILFIGLMLGGCAVYDRGYYDYPYNHYDHDYAYSYYGHPNEFGEHLDFGEHHEGDEHHHDRD